MTHMERIGVRELRQNASKYLRRVAAGESLTITDRGRPVAVLNPPPRSESLYEELVASGELIPAKRPFREVALSDPLPVKPGFSASAELERMRNEERY